MTPLEDTLRRAIRAKADEIPPDAVPPLRLPARRRRSLPLAYGGGESKGVPARRGWREWLAPAASAALVAAVVAGPVAVSHVIRGAQTSGRHQLDAAATRPDAAIRNEAAQWVAAQVSRTAGVSCDPVMCLALKAHGVPAGSVDELRPDTASPLGSDVIVATAAVRGEFGSRLGSLYAPQVIASFGSGSARIDVRVIAPHGPAGYRSALRADLSERKAAGTQLLANKEVTAPAAARRQLLAGQVDSRLLITIVSMAALHPVYIAAFGDSGPGAGADCPLRSADLAGTANAARTGGSGYARLMIRPLDSQVGIYRAARAEVELLGAQEVLRVEFAAPGPPGLIASPGSGGA